MSGHFEGTGKDRIYVLPSDILDLSDPATVERLAAALRAQTWNYLPWGVRKGTFRNQARSIIAALRDAR